MKSKQTCNSINFNWCCHYEKVNRVQKLRILRYTAKLLSILETTTVIGIFCKVKIYVLLKQDCSYITASWKQWPQILKGLM
jgi:hypothetical protein